jgi:hypothetical protein
MVGLDLTSIYHHHAKATSMRASELVFIGRSIDTAKQLDRRMA